jgi:hypothetical protein
MPGGGGGASSTVTIAQVPFYSITDTLYVQVGLGGLGGRAGTQPTGGSPGGSSYVSFYPEVNMANMLVANYIISAGIATNPGGNGRAPGTFQAGPAGTSAPALTVSATNNPRYLSLCNWASYTGQNGAAGSNGSVGPGSITIANNLFTSGGAGGGGYAGGTNQSGGSQNSGDTLTSFLKTVSGGVTGAGASGYSYLKPFLSVGGAGGGGFRFGVAGAGGSGQLGSGGGGGAGGTTGGAGGKGGDGLVMIISY